MSSTLSFPQKHNLYPAGRYVSYQRHVITPIRHNYQPFAGDQGIECCKVITGEKDFSLHTQIQSLASGCFKGFVIFFLRVQHVNHCLLGQHGCCSISPTVDMFRFRPEPFHLFRLCQVLIFVPKDNACYTSLESSVRQQQPFQLSATALTQITIDRPLECAMRHLSERAHHSAILSRQSYNGRRREERRYCPPGGKPCSGERPDDTLLPFPCRKSIFLRD